MGKGMYKSSWGVEFTQGSCVTLHPDGLKTYAIPGTLTSASPLDTFANTSKRPYQWLSEAVSDPLLREQVSSSSLVPHPKHFTVTCWFYHSTSRNPGQKVLIQTSDRVSSVYLDVKDASAGGVNAGQVHQTWVLTDEKSTKRPLVTPALNPGWHMLSIVSTTRESEVDGGFNGTKFYIDDWQEEVEDVWIKNDFYMVGNDSGTYDGRGGRKPFGLVTDFRIYARDLSRSQIERMAASFDESEFPDKIVQKLAEMDAAKVLARRLDVPDSAAECLRALAGLATLSSQRVKIYNVCGRQVLTMLDSPLPMIKRQAARLLNNLA